ncbi:MAG: antibiotic biosynthesis monooxygenase [Pseudonocardiales bacterium]|nr:antibiotic biosynthesis monooxygenase [Pseudonocardiales bacterium]PZS29833.1 MAG: antibiotic biosynthesis monooxygenase [Pseudonocardiales bacterium]
MILICRFAVDPDRAEGLVTRARRALELLTAQRGCLGGQLGRSPDDTTRWVLAVQFESVVAYRRTLSVFEVREHVVPLLSEALTGEPGSYEVLAAAEGGAVTDHASLLEPDAERGFGSDDR